MAKVTLTLSDTDEDGGVNFKVEFDPPGEEGDELTAAQSEAALVIDIIRLRAEGYNLGQIAETLNEADYGDIVTVPDGN